MKSILEWPPFSKKELRDIIKKYSSLFILKLDHISWWHFKVLVDNNKCISNSVNIANTCINLSYWLSHFKMSTLIIISKSNKVAYNSLKMFWPIVFLNILGKFIEKVISKRLQTQSISSNFVHCNQSKELK